MAGGLQKIRTAGSLKEAVAALVVECGGQTECATRVRVSRTQIAKYTDESGDNETVHMPVDVALALEKACAVPAVTRFMAGAQGYALVDLRGSHHQSYAVTLSNIGKETGDLFSEATAAMADGKMTAPESGRVRREALELAAACMALLADLPEGGA